MNSAQQSYQNHSKSYDRELADSSRQKITESWFRRDTIDSERHAKHFQFPYLVEDKASATWVTVGDGRYGLDAIRIKEAGGLTVLATDIAKPLLIESKNKGLISDYRIENAEKMTFDDNSFTYSFCKESYHHFPRPSLAIYEMLRISSKAVVLSEPCDEFSLIDELKFWIKKTLKKATHRDQFNYEDSGNFVFSITRREMEKVALGLNLPMVCFKRFCDHYIPGLEFITNRPISPLLLKFKFFLGIKSILAFFRLRRFDIITAVIFKELPSAKTLTALQAHGWEIRPLPRNPYIKPQKPV